MNGMRILGVVCAGVLASSLGTLVACGSPDAKEVPTAQAVQAATVSISVVDAAGHKSEGTGVLIAPRLVLTSGHLIAGKAKWTVTNGKTQVTGSRGLTYDWLKYENSKAHPRKHDIGVIQLDTSIKLDAYPRLVADKSADGTKATRVRGTGGGAFQTSTALLGRIRENPNNYLADLGGETLDTGGAVYDDRGILGIVSGKGKTTGKLYIARTDRLVKWLAPKIACAGGAVGTRTYAEQGTDKSAAICEDGGAATGNNNGNGGNANGGNGPNASGNGPNGNNGNDSNSCSGDNNGLCSGACVGGPGASGGTNGSNGENNGANPNGGAGAGSAANGSNGENNGANPNGGNGANGGTNGSNGENNGGVPNGGASAGNGSNGSNGENNGANPNGGNANGGNNGENNGAAPSSGGAGAGSAGTGADADSGEGCQGATDTPELCPPDPDGATSLGGGFPDMDVDFGQEYGGMTGGDSTGGVHVN